MQNIRRSVGQKSPSVVQGQSPGWSLGDFIPQKLAETYIMSLGAQEIVKLDNFVFVK